jgi:hypothetical protein
MQASTSRKTSSIEICGIRRAAWPKCLVAALSEKVPSGPRKAMPSGCSSDRQADITSRKNQVTLSFDSGPGFILLDPLQHLRLTLRAVNETRLTMARLDLADLLRQPGTLVQQRQQLPVEAVDLLADDRQFALQIVAHQASPA